MRIDPTTGWLEDLHHVASPNCDERPGAVEIDLLVVHSISLPPGVYGGDYIGQLFTNTLSIEADPYFEKLRDVRVSAHALIRRGGEITQFVPFHRRAWHAGESSFSGRPKCNDFSIGIELEGCDEDPYELAQYERLAQLAKELMRHWPRITMDRIVGHSTIAPGRKTDPGPAFDWNRFRALLREMR